MRLCARCGQVVNDDETFCSRCGGTKFNTQNKAVRPQVQQGQAPVQQMQMQGQQVQMQGQQMQRPVGQQARPVQQQQRPVQQQQRPIGQQMGNMQPNMQQPMQPQQQRPVQPVRPGQQNMQPNPNMGMQQQMYNNTEFQEAPPKKKLFKSKAEKQAELQRLRELQAQQQMGMGVNPQMAQPNIGNMQPNMGNIQPNMGMQGEFVDQAPVKGKGKLGGFFNSLGEIGVDGSSVKEWFGILVLMSVPIINIIIIIKSLTNVNTPAYKKSYMKAYIFYLILSMIISLICAAIMGALITALSSTILGLFA